MHILYNPVDVVRGNVPTTVVQKVNRYVPPKFSPPTFAVPTSWPGARQYRRYVKK
jgi:hypothetical protein